VVHANGACLREPRTRGENWEEPVQLRKRNTLKGENLESFHILLCIASEYGFEVVFKTLELQADNGY